MTCIIGFIDKQNDCVWMGSDSLGSNGYTKSVQHQTKSFKHSVFKDVVIGSTTTFRHIDLLKYSEDLFDELDMYKETDIDHKYMVTKFIPKVITLFEENIKDTKEKGANFIVGAKNKLYEILPDYSVLEPELGFCAVGCGEEVAMGSLLTSKYMDLPPNEAIELALQAAEKYCCGVQRPFHIINTKDDKVIYIN